ncbi:hypothetical protein [Roseimarinus sediminis]|uniref:hypothetical protein n=1 Tax=Roseimarinus sediminis TaxID=1610899 RepID=UPI003D1924E1
MDSSRKNILLVLYKTDQTVFRLKDIALLTGETNFQSLNKRVNYLVKKKELVNIRKGIYALPEYKNEELASKIFTPSYLSIDYILQKEGVIFQYDSAFSSVSYLSRAVKLQGFIFSYRKIKNEILTNTTGIDIINDGIFVASAERAFLDYLYLNGDSYIDNPSILNKTKVKQILPIYSSTTLSKRVNKILKDV